MRWALLIHFLLLGNSYAGDALVAGATYYDSENTFLEVQDLIRRKDTDTLSRLMTVHHISDPVTQDVPIEILTRGNSPSSPAEFRFISSPTTFWTQSKFVFSALGAPGIVTATLPAESAVMPTATPAPPEPTPKPSPKPAPKEKPTKKTTDIVWHEVNGHMRWYNPHTHHPTPEKPKKRVPRVLRAEPAE